jgi:GNAT superfamily N-acetyltransferase
MTEPKIRPAVVADMTAVHEMITMLAVYERQPDAVTNKIERLIADGFGQNPKFGCLVAEYDKQIVGFALYYPTYSTWVGPCLYLEDLLVKEEHRGKGIGGRLFEHLLEIAKQTGVKRFSWQVLDWNETAIKFYKKYNAVFDAEWVNCKIVL